MGVCPCRTYYYGQSRGIWCEAMQIISISAERNTLGVCPCKIHAFWQKWWHCLCAHGERPGSCQVPATRHQVCAYPCLDTPIHDAVRLWTAQGPRLCRVEAARHQVCACPCLDISTRDAVRLWTALRPGVCPVAATRTDGIGHVPMQSLLLLAEVNALGVCPCRIYYFWQSWWHSACVHAEFFTFGRSGSVGRASMGYVFFFGRTDGIGRVPMQNLLFFCRTESIGRVPMQNYYFWQN